MKVRRLLTAMTLLLAVMLMGSLFLSAHTPSGLEGVWRISQSDAADGGSVNRAPLSNLVIFTPEHYSLVRIAGTEAPRRFETHWLPTDAEKLARYDAMFVNAGTYDVAADRLTMMPSVARVPEFVGGSLEYRYRLEEDVLTLTGMDEHSFDGVQAPWATRGEGNTLTLRRVDR